jgi:hypothetical protein
MLGDLNSNEFWMRIFISIDKISYKTKIFGLLKNVYQNVAAVNNKEIQSQKKRKKRVVAGIALQNPQMTCFCKVTTIFFFIYECILIKSSFFLNNRRSFMKKNSGAN